MTCLWCIRHFWNRCIFNGHCLHLSSVFDCQLYRFCQLLTGWSENLCKGVDFSNDQFAGDVVSIIFCNKFHHFIPFGIGYNKLCTTKSLSCLLVQFQKLDMRLLIHHNDLIIGMIDKCSIFLFHGNYRCIRNLSISILLLFVSSMLTISLAISSSNLSLQMFYKSR